MSLPPARLPIVGPFVSLFLLLQLTPSVAQETRSVSLAWDASPDPGVTGYRVYYGFETGHPVSSIDVGETLSSAIPNLLCETDYYFVVTAYNAEGLQSAPSNEVMAPKLAVSLPQPSSVPFSVPLTQPLGVALTSPTENAEFILSSPITLEASVSDPGAGNALQVAFYAGWTKIGEDASRPYSLRWKPQTSGEYVLTARAFTSDGRAAVSGPIPVTFQFPGSGKGSRPPAKPRSDSHPEKKASLQAETKTARDENPEPADSKTKTVVIEASSDLQAWEPIAVMKKTDEDGNVEISDRSKPYPRFYRRVNP